MKNKSKILCTCIILLILGYVTLFILFGDPVVHKFDKLNSVTVTIRAMSDWEASIPLYAQVSYGFRKFESGAIYFWSPENIDELPHPNLRLDDANETIYLWEEESPNKVLLMVVPEINLIYPDSGSSINNYWDEVEFYFEKLKKDVKNQNLILYR
jgi:hypothetical protein